MGPIGIFGKDAEWSGGRTQRTRSTRSGSLTLAWTGARVAVAGLSGGVGEFGDVGVDDEGDVEVVGVGVGFFAGLHL